MKVIKFKSFAPMAEHLIVRNGAFVEDNLMPVLFTTNNCDTVEEAEKAITCWESNPDFILTKVWIDVFETTITDEGNITNKIGTIEYENKWVPRIINEG